MTEQPFRNTIRAFEIHRSARKHRVPDADIVHAFTHALARLEYIADEHPPRYALLGPDLSANMIEIVVIVGDGDRHVIIHATRARAAFLALLEKYGEST